MNNNNIEGAKYFIFNKIQNGGYKDGLILEIIKKKLVKKDISNLDQYLDYLNLQNSKDSGLGYIAEYFIDNIFAVKPSRNHANLKKCLLTTNIFSQSHLLYINFDQRIESSKIYQYNCVLCPRTYNEKY